MQCVASTCNMDDIFIEIDKPRREGVWTFLRQINFYRIVAINLLFSMKKWTSFA